MRVLVVEDEVELAAALGRGLRAEGYTVDVAHDGFLGLELARTDCYALIVLDLMLPGRSGYQVCRRLRRDGITTPILVLTAKDGVEDHTEALDSGADDFLAKPFSYAVLLATCARSTGAAPPGCSRCSSSATSASTWSAGRVRVPGRGCT